MTMQEKAVETAVKNGERMHGVYECIAVPNLPLRYYVQHIEEADRCYWVDARKGREHCQCEFFARYQVCKHLYFANEFEKIAQGEAMAKAQAEEEEGWNCAVCGTAVLFHRYESCERCAKRAI